MTSHVRGSSSWRELSSSQQTCTREIARQSVQANTNAGRRGRRAPSGDTTQGKLCKQANPFRSGATFGASQGDAGAERRIMDATRGNLYRQKMHTSRKSEPSAAGAKTARRTAASAPQAHSGTTASCTRRTGPATELMNHERGSASWREIATRRGRPGPQRHPCGRTRQHSPTRAVVAWSHPAARCADGKRGEVDHHAVCSRERHVPPMQPGCFRIRFGPKTPCQARRW